MRSPNVARQPNNTDADHEPEEANATQLLTPYNPGIGTWLYVSGLVNTTTVADVKNYVSKKIYRHDIECHLLLPRNINPTSRRLLSFKLRIPSSCAYTVLDKSFWPDGVNARYFVNEKDF